MSRYGEKSGEFGGDNTRAYYKAQAPPGGKSNICFGGPEEPQKQAPKVLNENQESKESSKENTPRDVVNSNNNNTQKDDWQTDPEMHKKLAKKQQAGNNIFGYSDADNKPKKQQQSHDQTTGQRDPILPKSQLDMKSNAYPAAGDTKKDDQKNSFSGVKVRQPPGGASSGLW
jgi:hypothetical protein